MNTAELRATIGGIQRDVELLRGISPWRAVVPTFVDEADLETAFDATPPRPVPTDVLRRESTIVGALGLVDGVAQDHDPASPDIGLLGFYRPSDQHLFVLSPDGTLGAQERITFAHEYTHALQDQRSNLLQRFSDPTVTDTMSPDTLLAWQALIEGDATLSEDLWARQHEQALLALPDGPEAIAATFDVSGPTGYLDRMTMFPYLQGLDFVRQVEGNGWLAVDRAFDDPPVSTEQILHFDKWVNRELPKPVTLWPAAVQRLGPDWALDGAPTTLGELELREWLIAHGVPETTAAAAAAGWGGDSLQLYRGPNGAWVMIDLITWDALADAQEFSGPAQRALDALTGPHAYAENADGTALIFAGDPQTLARAVNVVGSLL
jgi:hypothetical protein